MKTIKTYSLLFVFFVLAIMPASVFAGDYASLNFIGFSADGKYLAFEEYGVQDGSGFPYSNYFFIETAKNSYAAAPVKKMTENESVSEEAIRATAKKAAAANLKKFKIVAGNTGEMLVARLLTDLNVEKPEPGAENKDQSVKFTDYRQSSYFENEYELALKTSKIDLKRCDYNYEPTLMLELTLKDVKANTQKILQKDKDLPESRGCPHTYSIQNVYVYKGKLAAFINVYSLGFEGPDMRFMVVAGNYK